MMEKRPGHQRRSLLFADTSTSSEDFERGIKEIDEILGEENIKISYPVGYMDKLQREYEERVKIGKEFRKTAEADMEELRQIRKVKLDESILLPHQVDKLNSIQDAVDSYQRSIKAIVDRLEILKHMGGNSQDEEINQKTELVGSIIKKHVFK